MTIPYFYIIRHIPSGFMYAGSKYAKNCSPDDLLKEHGYLTSSRKIKFLIKKDGISSFEILRIDTFCDNLSPFEYETLFLEVNDCANSPMWMNSHNNKMSSAYGTTSFKHNMIEKYGVENPMELDTIKQKLNETNLKKYGVKWTLQDKNVRTKGDITKLEKYGTSNHNSVEIIKNKKKNTCFQNYGVENPSQSDTIKNKKQTTCKKNFGVDYPSQSPLVREKIKSKMISLYGVENAAKLPENRKKTSERAKIKILCPHCNKMVQFISRNKYHFDNCKLNK